MQVPAKPASWFPRRKVVVSVLAGAAVTILDYVLRLTLHVEQPADAVAAEVVLIGAAFAYLIPEADQVSGLGA